ncbi:MAG: hypothetical protein WAL25_08335 [Acidimicrobiia bacterium]
MRVVLVIVGIAISMYALHRLAVYAESRGWIFYRSRPPRVKMLGLLEELVEPRVEHQIVEMSSEAIRADHAESGDGYGDIDEPE